MTSPQKPSVADTATATDSPTVRLTPRITLGDSVTISESQILGFNPSFVVVGDSYTVTDAPTISVPVGALSVSVGDTVTASGDHDISFLIGIFDAPTIAIQAEEPRPNVSDTATVSDAITIELDKLVPSVTDETTVTDAPTLTLLSYVSVADETTLTDAGTISVVDASTIQISVSDSIAVSGDHDISFLIGVFDNSTIVVVGENDLSANVSDTVTVTEAVAVALDKLLLSVSDSSTVTDAPVLSFNYQIVVSDLTTVTDAITMFAEALNINVSEDITISEGPTGWHEPVMVYDTASLVIADTIASTDTATVTDAATLTLDKLVPSVSDTTTVTDAPTVNLRSYVSAADTTTVTTDPTLNLRSYISVADTATGTDAPTLAIVDISSNAVNAADTSTVTDAPTLNLRSYVSVSDTTTLTDTPTIELDKLVPQASDTVTVSESTSVSIFDASAIQVSVSDTVTAIENRTQVAILLRFFESKAQVAILLNMFDSATVVEGEPTGDFTINVSETVTVTESRRQVAILISVFDTPSLFPNEGIMSPNISEPVTMTESVTLRLPALSVNVSESITITEGPADLWEPINVTDSPFIIIIGQGDVNVNDGTLVLDTATIQIDKMFPVAADVVTVSESPILIIVHGPDYFIDVSDLTTITDNPSLVITSQMVLVDSSTVTDSPLLSIRTVFVVSDTATVVDLPSLNVPGYTFLLVVSDVITVTDLPPTPISPLIVCHPFRHPILPTPQYRGMVSPTPVSRATVGPTAQYRAAIRPADCETDVAVAVIPVPPVTPPTPALVEASDVVTLMEVVVFVGPIMVDVAEVVTVAETFDTHEIVIDMAFYIESSPRVSPDGLATRYMFILPPSRDKVFRTIGPYVGGAPGDWSVWEEEAIPVGSWRRVYGCNFTGSAIGFADDATMMSKALCTVAEDPYPQADNPWVAYSLNVPAKLTSGNPTIVPDPFWNPALTGRAALAYIGTDELLHSMRATDPVTCISFEVIDEGTNELPTGRTWNHILSRQNTAGDEFIGALAVGVGDKVARWLDGASSWTLKDCPDGDWRCSAIGFASNTLVMVGVGSTSVAQSLDYANSWSAYTPSIGWIPVNPRVVFDPELNVPGTQGTFIVTGGRVGGSEAVMLIPLNNDDSLGTAVLAGLPSLPTTVILRAAAIMLQTVGVMITGFDTAFAAGDPDGIIVITNPELSKSGSTDTYDDWHLRTIAQTPFGGLT